MFWFSSGLTLIIEAEKRKKEQAERKAKLDEIAEKQRQRELELEEKAKRMREEVLKGPIAPPPEPSVAPAAAPPAVAPSSGSGKYVPKWKRQAAEVSGPSSPTPTPPAAESDSWTNRGPPQNPDKWTSGSSSSRPSGGDTWRSSRPRPGQR